MSCKGLHCGGCGKGGGGAVPIGLIVLVVIGYVVVEAVAPAVSEAFRVLAVVLEVVLISVVTLAAVGAVGALSWVGLKVYRWHSGRRPSVAPVGIRAEVISSEVPALEAPKSRLDSLPVIRKEVNR